MASYEEDSVVIEKKNCSLNLAK